MTFVMMMSKQWWVKPLVLSMNQGWHIIVLIVIVTLTAVH